MTVKSLVPDWLRMPGRSLALAGASGSMFEAEQLEGRKLMSCSFSSGVLSLTGTNNNDIILIYRDTPGGTDTTYIKIGGDTSCNHATSGVTGINVSGSNGDDDIEASSSDIFLFGGNNDPIIVPMTLSGGDGADAIHGGDAADIIHGDAGNDSQLWGGGGNDYIAGDDGDDAIQGYGGADTLNGFYGNDSIMGDGGNDTMYGDDTNIASYGGADTLKGGDGNDLMCGWFGGDSLEGEAGVDTMYGGDGNDILRDADDASVDYLYGEDGNDTFNTPDTDSLIDVINGGAGTDTVNGYNGTDTYVNMEVFNS